MNNLLHKINMTDAAAFINDLNEYLMDSLNFDMTYLKFWSHDGYKLSFETKQFLMAEIARKHDLDIYNFGCSGKFRTKPTYEKFEVVLFYIKLVYQMKMTERNLNLLERQVIRLIQQYVVSENGLYTVFTGYQPVGHINLSKPLIFYLGSSIPDSNMSI